MADHAGPASVMPPQLAVPVGYGADHVQTLTHDIPIYFQDLGTGVSRTMSELTTQAALCPEQEIILAVSPRGHGDAPGAAPARGGTAILGIVISHVANISGPVSNVAAVILIHLSYPNSKPLLRAIKQAASNAETLHYYRRQGAADHVRRFRRHGPILDRTGGVGKQHRDPHRNSAVGGLLAIQRRGPGRGRSRRGDTRLHHRHQVTAELSGGHL
jgi:hypothetical protein